MTLQQCMKLWGLVCHGPLLFMKLPLCLQASHSMPLDLVSIHQCRLNFQWVFWSQVIMLTLDDIEVFDCDVQLLPLWHSHAYLLALSTYYVEQGLCICPSLTVYRSVQAWAHSSKPTGLLLWSWPAWDFSWLLHDAQQCGMRQVNAVPCQCTKEAELRLVIVVSLTLHVSVPLLACFVTPPLLRYFCIFVSTVLSVCRRCFYLFGELIFSSFCLVHLSPGLMKKLWVNFCQATTVMFYLVLQKLPSLSDVQGYILVWNNRIKMMIFVQHHATIASVCLWVVSFKKRKKLQKWKTANVCGLCIVTTLMLPAAGPSLGSELAGTLLCGL